MLQLRKAIKSLHARKDKAYGAAWKRRGERVSILPNIARKVDRLESFSREGAVLEGETIFDTAVDLYVYAAKYRLFLAESPEADASFIRPASPEPFSDHEENFDAVVDVSSFQDGAADPFVEHVGSIVALFEKLWRAADANTPLNERQELAGELYASAEKLVGVVAEQHPKAVSDFIAGELKY